MFWLCHHLEGFEGSSVTIVSVCCNISASIALFFARKASDRQVHGHRDGVGVETCVTLMIGLASLGVSLVESWRIF